MLEKIKEKEKRKNLRDLIAKLLVAFLIIQPILDIYMVLCDDKIQLMGMSLATILRFAWIGIMTLLTIILARKRKNTKFLIGYFVLVGIYAIFHHINSLKLDINMLNDEVNYSFLGEMFYLVRMLVPMCLIYIAYNIKPKYKEMKIVVVTVVIIMSLSMLITNLLGIDHISYSLTPIHPHGNILSWFSGDQAAEAWRNYSSKGLFDAGNEISAIFVILLPIAIYIALKEKKLWYFLVPTLQLIAMLMSSTRISVLGAVGITVGMFVLYVLMCLWNKKKIQISKIIAMCFMLVIFAIFFVNSPFELRKKVEGINISYNNIQDDKKEEKKKEVPIKKEFKNEEEKYQYIKENAEAGIVNEAFTNEIYPYQKDPDFWIHVVNEEEPWKYAENRGLKTLLLARVQERNQNPMDKYLGMSFMKISSFLWPERDFQAQYYYLGYIGLILLILPYVAILLYAVIRVLLNLKEKCNMKHAVYIAALLFGLVAGYYSGHVLDELFPTVYLGTIAGICLNNAREEKELMEEPEEEEGTLKLQETIAKWKEKVPVYTGKKKIEKEK